MRDFTQLQWPASASSAVPGASPQDTRERLLKLGSLPGSAVVLQRALDQLAAAECTNSQLEKVLLRDPAVAADVLRMANSALFGLQAEVRTISTAVRIVGRRRLEHLLRHLLVGEIFELVAARTPALGHIRSAALAAGVICGSVGEGMSGDHAEEYRVAGLMHNVGEAALAVEFPEGPSQLVGGASREEQSKSVFGIGYAEASGLLLESWRFPKIYVAAIGGLPQASRIEGPNRPLALALQASAILAEQWLEGRPTEQALRELDEALLEELPLEADSWEPIFAGLTEHVAILRGAF